MAKNNVLPLMPLRDLAEILNLLGNDTRLRLMAAIDDNREKSVTELSELLGVSISAVSQHLAKLKSYRLVQSRRDAQTLYYSGTSHPVVAAALAFLEEA